MAKPVKRTLAPSSSPTALKPVSPPHTLSRGWEQHVKNHVMVCCKGQPRALGQAHRRSHPPPNCQASYHCSPTPQARSTKNGALPSMWEQRALPALVRPPREVNGLPLLRSRRLPCGPASGQQAGMRVSRRLSMQLAHGWL